MSAVVIVDSSVLLNILDIPGRNQHVDAVLNRLGERIEAGDHLFIPMAAIVEVGNHIAHVANGVQRRDAAERFVREVRSALAGEAPWKPINFPSNQDVLRWLEGFPEAATRRSIQQEWQTCCARYPLSHVWVWTLDSDLAALDRPVPSASSRRKT